MNLHTIYLHKVDDTHVRLYQDGFKEQDFTLKELERALETEQDFTRALGLFEAKNFLECPLSLDVDE